jgi:hypothetical protein
MGCAAARGVEAREDAGALRVSRELPEELQRLPPFFVEILQEALAKEKQLGGRKRFPRQAGLPRLEDKVKREEFLESYTDFEYIFLTVVGFARLHANLEAISSQMNGQSFNKNPGVQMLERVCGMTMHGDRSGAQATLRQAPGTLISAFAVARARNHGIRQFFKEAFDRTADPCLEGRVSRLMMYLEMRGGQKGLAAVDAPPWEDVSLQSLGDKATPEEVVGDHLRVFMAECTWAWSREQGMEYAAAKDLRNQPKYSDSFIRRFNAATFQASMLSRGAVFEPTGKRWEHMQDSGEWVPYSINDSMSIEKAFEQGKQTVNMVIGAKGWTYEIDIRQFLQRNRKTGKDRPIRRMDVDLSSEMPRGKVTEAQLKDGIKYFVELATLPEAPLDPATPGSQGIATPFARK